MITKRIKSRLIKYIGHLTTEVYVVGYPKTGNTWLRLMLGKYMSFFLSCKKEASLPLFSEFGFIGNCKRHHPGFPTIQFTHSALDWDNKPEDIHEEQLIKPYMNKKVVLLYRNILDVMVSLYYHFKTRTKEDVEMDLTRFIGNDYHGIRKAARYYELWCKNLDRFSTNLISISYEQMHKDAEKELLRLLEFLNAPINPEHIQKAVEYSSFNNMKRIEKKEKSDPELFYKSSGYHIFASGNINENKNAYHVRKGKIDGYREEFGEEECRRMENKVKELFPFWDELKKH